MRVMVLKRVAWPLLAFVVFAILILVTLAVPRAFAQGGINYVGHQIIYDSINHDGIANPGELVYVVVTVTNSSVVTIYNVQGSLTAVDYHATCYGATDYDDMAPGQTKESGPSDLYFRLSNLTPNGRVIEFVVDLYDEYGTNYPVSFNLSVVDSVGPAVVTSSVTPKVTSVSQPVTITAKVEDGSGVAAVTGTVRSSDNSVSSEFKMYDDGAHGDGAAGNGVYGAIWVTPSQPYDFLAGFKTRDNLGNNRTYTDQFGFTSRPFARHSTILLVIDELNEPGFDNYYESALGANGFAYDLWYTFYRGPVPSEVIIGYLPAIVIWAVPEEGILNDPDDESARTTLMSYLDQGGKLFVTGQDIGYYVHDQEFYTGYLHAQFVQDSVGLYDIQGIEGDDIGDGMDFTIKGIGTGADNQQWPSEINAISPAQRVFEYYVPGPGAMSVAPTSAKPYSKRGLLPDDLAPVEIWPQGVISSGTAAVRVDTGTYKAVYFAFGFEGIDEAADRNAVMESVIAWLHGRSNFEKSLALGWNLVSLPIIPENKAITVVLSSIAAKYDLVQSYDAMSDTWRSYDPALPPEASDLLTLDERIPFWIHITTTATLNLQGLLPIITEQELVAGWNLVSYPASEPRTIADALSSISGKYAKALRYEAGEGYPWRRYNITMPAWANTLTQISPGWGYWLYVTEDCTLTIVN